MFPIRRVCCERGRALRNTTRNAATKWRRKIIILTASTSEAYSFVFRALCNPGDELLVPAPSYPLFGFLAGINDVVLAHYPLIYDHGWQIDFPSASASDHTPHARNYRGKPEQSHRALCEARGVVDPQRDLFGAQPGARRGRSLPGLRAWRLQRTAGARKGYTAPRGKRHKAADAGHEQWSAYLYDERTVENFRATADEGRVVGGQRAATTPEGCAGENRSHRRHLSVYECADTVGVADIFAAETWISEAGDYSSAAQRRGAQTDS